MAIYKEDIVSIELENGVIHRSFLNHSIGSGDAAANRFGIRVFRNGSEVDLSGVSCQAYFQNAEGTNIALTSYGTVSGNVAYVTLPQACYNVEGQFCLAIKLIGGGVTGTMRIIDGMVCNTGTTGAVAPTSSVPTYQEILSTYAAMVSATSAANLAIAEEFDASENYPAGKNVINDGALYVLPNGHTAGTTWANTTKVASNLGDQVTDLKSAIDYKTEELQKRTEGVFPIYGYLAANNKWLYSTPTTNSKSIVVEVKPNTKYLIRSTNTCVGAFLKTLPNGYEWESGTDMSTHYATGASRTTFTSGMVAGTTPSDAKYLVISLLVNGTNWSPTTMIIGGYNYLHSIIEEMLVRQRECIAYVTENAISWTVDSSNVYTLSITNSIIIRDYSNYSTAITITKAELLTIAGASSYVTVANEKLVGNNFAIYYDFTNSKLVVGALNTAATYNDSVLLFGCYYGSFLGGKLVENDIFIKEIKNSKLRKRNAIAYVSGDAISWRMTSTVNCELYVNADIVIRDSNHFSTAIVFTKEQLLSVAGDSEQVTVSNGKITGSAFGIYYDYESGSLVVSNINVADVYKDTLLLFAHYYASYTGGLLVDAKCGNISELYEKVAAMESQFPVVPDFLASEVTTTIGQLQSEATEKSMIIAFTTDNHYGASNGLNWPTTIATIKDINSKYKIDAVIDGGDMINGEETAANAKARLSGMIADMNISNTLAYALVGNHDDDSFTVSQEVLVPQDDLYALIGRPFSRNYDVMNGAKVYGYKDFPVFGIRLIMLDSRIGDDRNGEDPLNWGYDTDQINWLENVALNTDYQVAIFSHMGVTKEYAVANYQPVNGATVRNKIESFVSNGGVVIGFFHGHTHWDFIGQYSQTNGFHEVSTGCGRVQTFTPSYAPSGAVVPDRTSGTATQELYDFIVIKPESREVKMIRFGAGSDRSFSY